MHMARFIAKCTPLQRIVVQPSDFNRYRFPTLTVGVLKHDYTQRNTSPFNGFHQCSTDLKLSARHPIGISRCDDLSLPGGFYGFASATISYGPAGLFLLQAPRPTKDKTTHPFIRWQNGLQLHGLGFSLLKVLRD